MLKMLPLVSCIMPTANRRKFIPLALACFLAQDYPNKELIVVDDGDDNVSDLFVGIPNVTYYKPVDTGMKISLGEKRNLACSLANGELIAHFDDDDWSYPGRLSKNVNLLQDSKKPVVGYITMLFYDINQKRVWKYFGISDFCVGTSLLYKKDYWKNNQFPNKNIAEDNDFSFEAQKHFASSSIDVGQDMVAVVHGGNTSPHNFGLPAVFPEVPINSVPQAFLESIGH